MNKQIREIKVRDLLLYYGLTLFFIIVILLLFILFIQKIPLYILIPLAIILLYYPMKYHVIGMVLMYKAFAPMDVKSACRFQPTCSTYMIMAIKKYGLFIGVFKGIRRIMRCRPPNGGQDLP